MPVQVYTSSPIHASPPEGVTPKTAGSQDGSQDGEDHMRSPTTATTTSSSSTEQHGSPSAQPGARPQLPAQTDAPQAPRQSRYQPTQTQPTSFSPPPPQPGAVPSPVAGHSVPHLPPPPPPKTGEAAPSSSSSSSYQASHAPRFGYGARQSYPQANDGDRKDFSHPPGYQQNAHAADFSSAQLAAHHASNQAHSSYNYSSSSSFEDEESVWDIAKKWAAAAGDTIAAAENEIWKRINGD